MHSARRGEISTLLVAGMIVVVGVATLLTSTLNQERQTTVTQAAATPRCANKDISEGDACTTAGEWCIDCIMQQGPCADDAGVGIPFRCENGAWKTPSWGSECNVTCDILTTNDPAPTKTPAPIAGSTCIYSENGSCYTGVCFGQPCGYNLNCRYEAGYGQQVTCPSTGHGSNPTPTYVAGTPPVVQPTKDPASSFPTKRPLATLTPTPTKWFDQNPLLTKTPTPTISSCRPGEVKCPNTNRCVANQGDCITPTISSCRPGQVKCPGTNKCVENQGECSSVIYLPIIAGGGTSPTPTRKPIELFLPNSPTPTPIKVYLPILNQQGNVTSSGVVTMETETIADVCYIGSQTFTQQANCSSYFINRSDWNKFIQ